MSDPTEELQTARAAVLAAELAALVGKIKRRLREQASVGDLTQSQMAVLRRLEKDGPATSSGLARAEGMRPQSMGPLVAALEQAGFIAGTPDPNDGRQTILALTATFRGSIEAGRAARQDWLTRTIEARLSPGERARVAAAVELLNRLVED